MEVLLGISLTINLIVLIVCVICYLYYKKFMKSRKEIMDSMKFFGEENVEDEKTFQDFFNN